MKDVKNLLLKDKHLLQKLGSLEDEFIEQFIGLLYVESHSFVYFPINLFVALTNNPTIENKIMDGMFFILKS